GAAARLHRNDRRRVVRALELTELGSSLRPATDRLWASEPRRPTSIFGLDVPRDVLTERIERRARSMFPAAAGDEAQPPRAARASSPVGPRSVRRVRPALPHEQ